MIKLIKFRKFILLIFPCFMYSQVGINTNNPQGVFHVDGAKDNPSSGTPTGTPVLNDFIVTNVGQVGIGMITPKAKLDMRSSDGTNNIIGIGQTIQSASDAKAGAIRFSPNSGGVLQYSDGIIWNNLISNPTKVAIVSRIRNLPFTSQYQFPYQSAKNVTDLEEVSDVTNNFDPVTGTFTPIRDGIYMVTFTYDFVKASVVSGGFVESRFIINNTSTAKKCIRTFGESTRDSQVGGSCVASISMKKGDKLNVQLFQSTYSPGALSLRMINNTTNPDFGFNNITIFEQ